MTIDISIRPDAALNDHSTRRYVEEKVLNATFRFGIRHTRVPELAYNEDGIVNVLANYPWKNYEYKAGHWQKRPFINEAPFVPLREWAQFHTPILLLDPSTGRAIVQVTGLGDTPNPPAGQLRFAGDPQYAGVVESMIDGKQHISIMGSAHLADKSVYGSELQNTTIAERARDLTKSMVPGTTPQVPLYDLPANYLKNRGPWIADHPKKPPRKWKPEADDAQSGA